MIVNNTLIDGQNCSDSVTIPDSVTSIGESAFEGCTSLTIYGSRGSYAESYAAEAQIPFISSGD